MELLRWFTAGDPTPGSEGDLRWAWVTIALSVSVAAGYAVITFKWYFQWKLDRRREARAALARLGGLVVCCALCGTAFFASDMPWRAWRAYDLLLLLLSVSTWSFALRMRGLGLVDERLAQVGELERSANRYRDIAELLPHMVWTADARGRVDFSNRRWADFAGEGRDWLEAVHEAERDKVRHWWAGAVAGRQPVTREVRLEGRRGCRSFVVSATPVFHGAAVKWLGACADVEDQKLLAAEKETQAKRRAFFLNALSHDLRAPLNNVVLNAHLLKTSARGETEVDCAKVIVENAVAAGDLVTRLLEYATASGEEHVAAEPVEVDPLVRQVVRRFQPLASQKELYLRPAGHAGAVVMTDRQKLERILSNLVDNAIKYSRRGGVTVEVVDNSEDVRLCVRDTGEGVPAENVPYLFDEFYQVGNHERDRSRGFGMGLAICRCLAQQLGGEVRLTHTGPGGSAFELVLPGLGARSGGRPAGEDGDQAAALDRRFCGV